MIKNLTELSAITTAMATTKEQELDRLTLLAVNTNSEATKKMCARRILKILQYSPAPADLKTKADVLPFRPNKNT